MRVVKKPEERRREILKAAIRVFASKGYEKTAISDIAAESGISQGLCYRYYTSKEEIYDAAVEEYADLIVRENLRQYDLQGRTLKEMIGLMGGRGLSELSDAGQADPADAGQSDVADAGQSDAADAGQSDAMDAGQADMYQLFHRPENKKLHDQLFLRVGQKLVPVVAGILEAAKARGEIQLSDPEAAAYFVVFGQIGMLMERGAGGSMGGEEQVRRIQNVLTELLGL